MEEVSLLARNLPSK